MYNVCTWYNQLSQQVFMVDREMQMQDRGTSLCPLLLWTIWMEAVPVWSVSWQTWVVCQLKRLVPRRRQLRRSGSCAEQRLTGVTRLIGNDGKWSVVVNMHRRVCTVSIHISTSMYMSVTCTYKDINTCTCMYFVHLLGKIHVHTCTLACMYIYVHVRSMYIEVYTCT